MSRTTQYLTAAIVVIASPALMAHDATEVAGDLAMQAQRIVATLNDEQKAAGVFPFDSDKRQGWHFVPDKFIKEQDGKRFGLPMNKMTVQQRLLVQGLLGTALSHKGYRQATTIMAMETVLRAMENDNPIRDSELYYLSIFGDPAPDKSWAWRVEGHHLSINFTLAGGRHFSVTPSFFGSNPGKVPGGPLKDFRVLADEEDLARKLVKSLDEKQSKKAIIDVKAPEDVITAQDRRSNKGLFFPAKGVAFGDLSREQKKLLLELVDTFTAKHRPEVLKQMEESGKIADTKSMYFAWAGGLEDGQGHYFRVQTDRYIFEFDNTQNNANHVHAVWRSFDGDFGEDLMRKHYDDSHPRK